MKKKNIFFFNFLNFSITIRLDLHNGKQTKNLYSMIYDVKLTALSM